MWLLYEGPVTKCHDKVCYETARHVEELLNVQVNTQTLEEDINLRTTIE